MLPLSRFKAALAALALGAVAVMAAGCTAPAWLSRQSPDPAAEIAKRIGVRPDVVVTAEFAQVRVQGYSYQKAGRCGYGVSWQAKAPGGSSVGSGGEGSCKPPGAALDLVAMDHWTAPDGTQMLFCFGRVNGPKVARVVVTLSDGKKVDAAIQGNAWYLVLPSQDPYPASVEGLDKKGNPLSNTPAGTTEAPQPSPLERWPVLKELDSAVAIDVSCYPKSTGIRQAQVVMEVAGLIQHATNVPAGQEPKGEPALKVYFRRADNSFIMAAKVYVDDHVLDSPEGPYIKVDPKAVARFLEDGTCKAA